MAKIGLKYPVYAAATESTSAITYSGGAVLAKAITANIAITTNDIKLYADDVVSESDHSFSSGTIAVNIDDLTNAAQIALLGNTEGDTVDAGIGTKEIIAKGSDTPPYVGFGFYAKKVVAGVNRWRAIWLKKVQFAEPADDAATKGETTEYQTPTIEGTIMVDVTGHWKNEGTFSTEALAKAWLDGKAGIAAKSAGVTSSVASGTYTGAQSVALSTTEAAGTIYYTDDGTIPTAAATEYTTAIACADPSSTCIKAVVVAAGKSNSDILELYIIVTA